jgi:hypothetical protein
MKIFLSFAYDEDINQVNGFRSMLENPLANISFSDGSCKKDYAGKSEWQIKQYIASLVDNSSVTVCLISKSTKNSNWVNWELETSKNKSKGIVGLVLKDRNNEIKNINDCPAIFANSRYKVFYWDSPEVMQKHIEEAENNR